MHDAMRREGPQCVPLLFKIQKRKKKLLNINVMRKFFDTVDIQMSQITQCVANGS